MKHTLTVDARMWRASGIGTYLQNLVPRLRERFNLRLLAAPEEAAHLSATYEVVPASSPIYSVGEQIELPRKATATDLFWSPHYNVPLLPVRARRRVTTVHDVFHLAFRHTLDLPQRAYAETVLRAALHRSDRVLTVSEFSKNEILRLVGGRPERIRVVHNGIDWGTFRPASGAARAAVCRRYDLDGPYLIFVGNVKPHKNLVGLLHAFRRLMPSHPDLQLVVVGKKDGFITGDEEVPELLRAPDLAARVRLTGFVPTDDLPALYAAAVAFVFPSRYEGFGLPPLEAMACGCPTVVARAASLPEVCGEASAYVDPDDPADMAHVIHHVLTDAPYRYELVEAGYARAARFDWDSTAQAHAELFAELLG